MSLRLLLRFGLFALLAATSAAQAQDSASTPSCSALPASLPAELAAWPNRAAVKAGNGPAGPAIEIGRAIDAGLSPTPDVRYLLRPEKPGGPDRFGGIYRLKIEMPGTYRVALGSAAWIDLLRGDKAVPSAAHGHGPDCLGIRKVVDFALTPGIHVLQISGNGSKTMPLLVTRLP